MEVAIQETGSGVLSRHKVREGVQHMIISGTCKSGDRLAQQKLAKQFGVGQGVVREALLELQMSGLVETIDNRGVYVGQISTDIIIEAYMLREMHEGLAARLCCDHMARSKVRDLRDIAERIFELGSEGKQEEMGRLDRKFHNEIFSGSRNNLLIRFVEAYKILQKIIRGNRDPGVVLSEHNAILDAIEHGKADEAERLIREHIAIGRKYIEKQIEKGEFVPNWIKQNGDNQ